MNGNIDTLYTGAKFYTMTGEGESVSYLGVSRGRIVYAGDTKPKCRVGRTVKLSGFAYPGLCDAHTHLWYSIMTMRGVAACEMKEGRVVPDTVAGVCERLGEYAKTKKPGELIVSTNYIASAIKEGRLPNRFELDECCSGRPVIIYNIDWHSSALSTAALKLIGITKECDGILTGVLHEENVGALTKAISDSLDIRALIGGVATFTNECLKCGVTRVCALEGAGEDPVDPTMDKSVWLARRMKLGVRLYPQYQDVQRAEKYRKYQKSPRIGGCGQWEMDGSVGSHSAAMSAPFRDTLTAHELYNTDERIRKITEEAHARGYTISAHAIGDRAIDQIEDALYALNDPRVNRIEHYLFPSKRAVEKADSRLAVVLQPGYDWIDDRYLHSYSRHLPKELASLQVPTKTLYDKGVCVCSSSDCPIQPIDTFLQMLGCRQASYAEQNLTPYEALTTYTTNPARMLGEEDDWGTLALGREADFFVTDDDILTMPDEKLLGYTVRATYIAGRKVKPMRGTMWELLRMALTKPKLI